MRRHGRGLVAALEQEEIEVELQEDQIQEELPSDADLGTEFTEVDNGGGEAIVTELDSAEAVSDALESIYEVFHEAAGNGGFKIENAAAVNVAVESMLNTIGIKSDNKLIALESLNSTSERVVAVQFAMEGIIDKAKKVWDAVIAGIEKLFAWMKEFYNKIFFSTKKVLEKATKMQEEISKKDIPSTKLMFSKPHLFQTLNINGEVSVNMDADLNNVQSIYSSVVNTTLHVADVFKKNAHEIYTIEDTASSKNTGVNGVLISNFIIPALKISNSHQVSDPSSISDSFSQLKEKLSAFKTETLFGNKALLGVGPNTDLHGDDAFKLISDIQVKLIDVKVNKKNDNEEIPVLTKDSMLRVLNTIIELSKSILAFESKEKEIEKIKNQFVKDSKRLIGIFEKENSDQSYSYFSDAGKIARYMATTIDQPISAMTSYCAKISRTLLEYVSASLKEYDAGTSVAA